MFFFKRNKPFNYPKFLKKAAKLDAFALKEYEPLVAHLKETKTIVTPTPLGLTLLVVADTHGTFATDNSGLVSFFTDNKDYDLCVLLGDIHPSELETVLSLVPRERIIAVKGNHDNFLLYSSKGIREISGQEYLCKGISLVGLEGSFRYKNESFPSFTQYQSLKAADRLPAGSVLISHDGAFTTASTRPVHCGLVGLTSYIYKNNPFWHLHGHIHKSYTAAYDNGTNEKSVYLLERVEL